MVVDDSPSIDGEIFNLEEFEGADWVLIADEVPVDEARRDELLENFQATYHGGDGRMRLTTEDSTSRTTRTRTRKRTSRGVAPTARCWPWLAARAVPGIEEVEDGRLRGARRCSNGRPGVVRIDANHPPQDGRGRLVLGLDQDHRRDRPRARLRPAARAAVEASARPARGAAPGTASSSPCGRCSASRCPWPAGRGLAERLA